jgi:hypothetical protein
VSCTFDRNGQLALVAGASACNAAGHNLSAIRKIAAQTGNIFIIDVVDFIDTEGTNLLSALAIAGTGFPISSVISQSIQLLSLKYW